LGAAVAFSGTVIGSGSARADAAADFYKGKTITVVVSFGAGGTYGLHARLLERHAKRHLPGSPNVIIQHMPGAGGMKAANYLYNAAPKDGSYLGELFKDIAVTQVLRPDSVKYDANKFSWIGRMAQYPAVLWVTDKPGIKSIEEATRKEIILGATGKASASFLHPTLLNALVGTKFKVVTGYKGAADLTRAAEQGETAGWAGAAYDGFMTPGNQKTMWKEGKAVFLMQTGLKRQPESPNVPLLIDLVKGADAKRIASFMESATVIGFAITAPPGVPADRVAALRKAMAATTADPAYRKEAQEKNVTLDPETGEGIQRAVADALALPAPLAKRTREIMGF